MPTNLDKLNEALWHLDDRDAERLTSYLLGWLLQSTPPEDFKIALAGSRALAGLPDQTLT